MMCTRRDVSIRASISAAASLCRWPRRPRDPLLQRIRIVAVLEHLEIVVAFEHQRVAAGQARLDVGRGHAEVGQHAEAPRAVADDVLHRLARVVRNGYRLDLQRVDREPVVAVEAVDVRHALEALRDRGQRAERGPDRNAVPRRERRNTADMIGVLVRDEDRGERRRLEPEPGEASRRAPNAEAAVDQDARAARLDDEAVAFAAAAQGGEAHPRRAAT